ncbi:hypothetical protein ACFQZ4_03955 [Catellatospora coxensis]
MPAPISGLRGRPHDAARTDRFASRRGPQMRAAPVRKWVSDRMVPRGPAR